ncbi:hypothetical protein IAQ61_002100 [Plenodomus lingam]|uniref:Predicted protein n=1 Tax=Leptosphaeria maculans (strain JN3 / isolate v23.1.3 / race Av1-4-5-6-7-8) TaxID=985895 RepID=E4ZH37_LEPMJ|nr:predicted protein [Plenodomus lingam JN3]KAH9876740.1 hypothetical protein IAQ61_002100 [Plenodomus lingam]CBX90607.1 predicted protein [Plenodomus lingam JN3]
MSSQIWHKKLLRRLRRPDNACHILNAPAEIRIFIYRYIAPQGFLPYTPYQHYMGLFLCCKKINGELTHETLRGALTVLDGIYLTPTTTVTLLRPLQPHSFTSLMHVSLDVPLWSLYSTKLDYNFIEIASPLMKLHLSSLTIALKGISSPSDFALMSAVLSGTELWVWNEDRNALNNLLVSDADAHYDVHTTYDSIVGFVAAINCLLAPQLCNDNHQTDTNVWCARARLTAPLADTVCNIRKVIFTLKQFHDESPLPWGELPRDTYPENCLKGRWMPAVEQRLLRREGWEASWAGRDGRVNVREDDEPSQFVWKMVKKENRWRKLFQRK